MSKESLAQRLVAMETGIDSTRIGTGYIDEQERDRVSHAFGKLSTAPIYIDDSVGVGIMELQSRALRMKAEYGIELLVIDYLQLMMGFTNGNYTREEEVSEISSRLKVLAGKLNLPIICLSQMSSAEKKSSSPIPQLSDLWKQDCNSLEGDADLVLFIYREEMFNPKTEKKNIAEIHIAKHRHGLTGVVQLSFDNQTTRFDNLIPYLG
jgi:replicative DNA helicase